MSELPRLIGMVHLRALPGAPGFDGDLDAVIAAAADDAKVLATAGFGAVMVENFGDAPFFAEDVPKATIAAMTAAVGAVRAAAGVPIGVNVLRNDAPGALAVAAATGAAFIRVNVLSGTMYTDQGPITGRAADVARARQAIAPEVAVLADVFVKHATPPPGLTLEHAARDTAERAGADALVISGAGTGSATAINDLRRVRAAVGGFPLLAGSGVDANTIGEVLTVAHGAIVGTSIKEGGITTNRVDPARAAELVAAFRREQTP